MRACSRDSSHVYVQYVCTCETYEAERTLRALHVQWHVCDVHAMCTLTRREILWRRAQRAEYIYILLLKRKIEIYLLLNIIKYNNIKYSHTYTYFTYTYSIYIIYWILNIKWIHFRKRNYPKFFIFGDINIHWNIKKLL